MGFFLLRPFAVGV